MLAATGFWPPNIPFDIDDLATVVEAINEDRKGGHK